jgi:bile acid:Na+ symporter, BASS family
MRVGGRTFGMLAAMIAGAILPIPEAFQAAIRPLLICMLFLVFLEARTDGKLVHRSHFLLLGANFALGILPWLVLLPFNADIAKAAFFAGITPTATAAAAVTGLLGGRVAYVVTAFFLSNVVMAFALPLLIPFVVGTEEAGSVWSLALSTLTLVGAPLGTALLVRRFWPGVSALVPRLRGVSFFAWLVVLCVVMSGVRRFVEAQETHPWGVMTAVGGVSLALCAAGFLLGRRIGGPDYVIEGGQALGQKNTMLTLYLALAYAGPVAALGPAFYIIWHNLWNAWQVGRRKG